MELRRNWHPATESFNTHGHIHSHKRNILTTDKAAKIKISYNWNLLHKHKGDDNDDYDEPLSTPTKLLSPLRNPITEERPSTSRGNTQEIEFYHINNIFNDHDSSDSD